MCAGVPPTGMVPQWETAVVDPGMVTGAMVAEETNPWSAAKRVEALMSSPQTPVKELTYPTVSQDLIDQADAREKEKYEELKQQAMEFIQRGKTEIQQDRENLLATREEKRQVNKRPKWVVKTAQQAFGYLKGTETQYLSYGVCTSDDRGPEDDLPFHREMQQVEMFSDISFAPAGERSLQGILGFYGGGLVQWEASRQASVVLSTDEGELMSYLESMVMGDSLASLIEVVEGRKIGQKIIYGDNTAAIAILENPDCPWRTRHLRLRATALRERLKDGSWIIHHLPGVKLVADFLTKIITVKPSWERFWILEVRQSPRFRGSK